MPSTSHNPTTGIMKHQLLGLADRLARIKVVLCDLDHTLLDADQQVPPGTDGLLDRWLSAGYGFVIATGREPRRARNLSPVLGQCPLICYNGTWIEHLGDVKYARPMSSDLTKSAIECLRRTNPNAWIGLEIDDRLYAPKHLVVGATRSPLIQMPSTQKPSRCFVPEAICRPTRRTGFALRCRQVHAFGCPTTMM